MFSGISLIANIDQVLARRSQVKAFDMMMLGLRARTERSRPGATIDRDQALRLIATTHSG